MTDIEKLLTPEEMAARFRVDVKTVARWHKNGRLAAAGIRVIRTVGGVRRFVAADVERYIAQGGGR